MALNLCQLKRSILASQLPQFVLNEFHRNQLVVSRCDSPKSIVVNRRAMIDFAGMAPIADAGRHHIYARTDWWILGCSARTTAM